MLKFEIVFESFSKNVTLHILFRICFVLFTEIKIDFQTKKRCDNYNKLNEVSNYLMRSAAREAITKRIPRMIVPLNVTFSKPRLVW